MTGARGKSLWILQMVV